MLRDWEDRLASVQSQLASLRLELQREDYFDTEAIVSAAMDHAGSAALQIVYHIQQVAPVRPIRPARDGSALAADPDVAE
jgi:hypothetical protein